MKRLKIITPLFLMMLCLSAFAQDAAATPAHEKDCVCVEGASASACTLCTQGKCSACILGKCPLTQGKTFCTLKIDGMTCGGCAAGAQNALLAVPGVISATVDWEKGTGVVAFDAEKVTPDAIAKAELPATQTLTLVKKDSKEK